MYKEKVTKKLQLDGIGKDELAIYYMSKAKYIIHKLGEAGYKPLFSLKDMDGSNELFYIYIAAYIEPAIEALNNHTEIPKPVEALNKTYDLWVSNNVGFVNKMRSMGQEVLAYGYDKNNKKVVGEIYGT